LLVTVNIHSIKRLIGTLSIVRFLGSLMASTASPAFLAFGVHIVGPPLAFMFLWLVDHSCTKSYPLKSLRPMS